MRAPCVRPCACWCSVAPVRVEPLHLRLEHVKGHGDDRAQSARDHAATQRHVPVSGLGRRSSALRGPLEGCWMALKGLGPLPRTRGSALALCCGREGRGALPLPKAAAVSTRLRVRRHLVRGPAATHQPLVLSEDDEAERLVGGRLGHCGEEAAVDSRDALRLDEAVHAAQQALG
jgi:hypothetical protein